MKSRQDGQLRSPKDENDVKSCAPEDTVGGEPIVPCGLVAWSLFNDTYDFTRNNQKLSVNKKDISWKSDRDSKFGKNVFPKNFQKGFPIGGKSLDPKIPVSDLFLKHKAFYLIKETNDTIWTLLILFKMFFLAVE